MNVEDPVFNSITNSWSSALIFGKSDGTYFSNKGTAILSARMLKLGGGTVESEGGGWFIRVKAPLDETDEAVRNILNTVPGTETPNSLVNSMVGWIRPPDDTMSFEQRMNRKLATYGPSVLKDLYNEEARNIKDLVRGVVRHDPVTGDPIPLWVS